MEKSNAQKCSQNFSSTYIILYSTYSYLTIATGGDMVRPDKHGRPIYNFKIPDTLEPGELYRLVVQPTAGCKFAFCRKRSAYTFQVAV